MTIKQSGFREIIETNKESLTESKGVDFLWIVYAAIDTHTYFNFVIIKQVQIS